MKEKDWDWMRWVKKKIGIGKVGRKRLGLEGMGWVKNKIGIERDG